MSYNNLKYSIWNVLINVLYLIIMVTYFVFTFDEIDITLSKYNSLTGDVLEVK